jgi:hypothetical protein
MKPFSLLNEHNAVVESVLRQVAMYAHLETSQVVALDCQISRGCCIPVTEVINYSIDAYYLLLHLIEKLMVIRVCESVIGKHTDPRRLVLLSYF